MVTFHWDASDLSFCVPSLSASGSQWLNHEPGLSEQENCPMHGLLAKFRDVCKVEHKRRFAALTATNRST